MFLNTPFHSKIAGTNVHHDNPDCHLADNIWPEYRLHGTGGLPLCDRCNELNQEFIRSVFERNASRRAHDLSPPNPFAPTGTPPRAPQHNAFLDFAPPGTAIPTRRTFELHPPIDPADLPPFGPRRR